MTNADHLLDLFTHPGWEVFVEEMREARDGFVATAWQCRTVEELHAAKGRIEQLSLVLNYADLVRAQMEEDTREEAA